MTNQYIPSDELIQETFEQCLSLNDRNVQKTIEVLQIQLKMIEDVPNSNGYILLSIILDKLTKML